METCRIESAERQKQENQRTLGGRDVTVVAGAGGSWRKKKKSNVLGRAQIVEVWAPA